MRIKSWSTLILFCFAMLAISGCGLFEPRTPEQPGGGGTWVPPTTPEIVLDNLATSMKQKVIANYGLNFTADFVFHPDPSDSIQLTATQPYTYDNWTDSIEVRVAQTIFDETAAFDLAFTKRDTTIFVDPDHCVFYYKYFLQVTSRAGGTEYYRGLVEFHLRREGGANWYIYVWIDKRDPDFSSIKTWGYLKGTRRT